MKIQFATNLGSRDAKALGLDYTACSKEAVLEVPQATGEELIKRGIATAAEKKAERAAEKAPEPTKKDH